MIELITGPDGFELITRNESFRSYPYLDPVGVWTNGYGNTGPDIGPNTPPISEPQARQLLLKRLAIEFEPAVRRAIGDAPTTQTQFDAMVSLSYNIGASAFEGSSVARFHKQGNYAAAANAFRLWNKAGGRILTGLIRRRDEEAALYMKTAPLNPKATIRPIDLKRADQAYDNFLAATERLQRRLLAAGFDPGPIDRIYGEKTERALNAFKKVPR